MDKQMTPAYWPRIKFFKPHEFVCSHCGAEHMQKDTVLRLDLLRERLNTPLILSSAYRCPEHPIEKAKTKPGVHSTGHAIDIACNGELAYRILTHAPSIGFNRIGVNQKGSGRFIHLDDYVGSEFVRMTVWSY